MRFISATEHWAMRTSHWATRAGERHWYSAYHTHTFTRPYRNYIANNVHISTLSLIKVHSSIHSTYPSLIHLSNSSSHPTNHPSFIHPFHQPTHQPVIYPLIQPSSNPSAHRFRYNSFSQFVLAIRHKKKHYFMQHLKQYQCASGIIILLGYNFDYCPRVSYFYTLISLLDFASFSLCRHDCTVIQISTAWENYNSLIAKIMARKKFTRILPIYNYQSFATFLIIKFNINYFASCVTSSTKDQRKIYYLKTQKK